MQIKNSTIDVLLIINNADDGYNKVYNKTEIINDLSIVDHELVVKNGTSNVIILNESVTGNNTFTGKTIFSNLNILNGQTINSTGDTLYIGDNSSLATLKLTTTTLDGIITITASRINLVGNVYINGMPLAWGLVNPQSYDQY